MVLEDLFRCKEKIIEKKIYNKNYYQYGFFKTQKTILKNLKTISKIENF